MATSRGAKSANAVKSTQLRECPRLVVFGILFSNALPPGCSILSSRTARRLTPIPPDRPVYGVPGSGAGSLSDKPNCVCATVEAVRNPPEGTRVTNSCLPFTPRPGNLWVTSVAPRKLGASQKNGNSLGFSWFRAPCYMSQPAFLGLPEPSWDFEVTPLSLERPFGTLQPVWRSVTSGRPPQDGPTRAAPKT